MAVGDITGLRKAILDAFAAYNPMGLHRGSNVFVCVYNQTGSGNIVIRTFSVSGDGTSTNVDFWDTGLPAYTWYGNHISGGIFAVSYSDFATQAGVTRTFSVAADGTITKSWIATLTWASGAFPEDVWMRCPPVACGNHIWLIVTQASNDISAWTISISDDGATMTEVDKQGLAMTQNKGIAVSHANGLIYAIYSEQLVNDQTIFTIEVAGNGAITAKSSLGLGNVSAGNPGMFKVTDGIICISRTTGLETRAIGSDGSIGASAIDTEAFAEIRFWIAKGGNIWNYVNGDTVYTKTFLSDGTIGSQISTYDFDIVSVGVPHIVEGADEMHTALIPGGGTFDLYSATYTILGVTPRNQAIIIP